MDLLFKLYPWEWMLDDAFGRSEGMERTRFVEPIWKMALSTKAILPFLWEMAPDHPNLLPSYFEDDPRCARLGNSFVKKPLHSREGANVAIVRDGRIAAQTPGAYGRQSHVRQALACGSGFDGKFPVFGTWIVGRAACGLGIREDVGPTTSNNSRFVPHAIAV